MPTFWAKTKRRAVAVLAGAAAGAAAGYCAYNWYYSAAGGGDDENQRGERKRATDEAQSFSTGAPHSSDEAGPSNSGFIEPQPPVLISPSGSSGALNLDAEAHLQHHFDSIQKIADGTTLPSLLPALARALEAANDVDAFLGRLRAAKEGSLVLSGEEKIALWQQLATTALARLVCALWALPLLDIQVRVQLNVLGRHLYLETALAEHSGGDMMSGIGPLRALAGAALGRHPPPVRLSVASQEAFLSFTEHLAKAGHEPLAAIAYGAAKSALADVPLDMPLSMEKFSSILSAAQEAFASQGLAVGWPTFLLPPPAGVTDALRLNRPDDRALMPGSEAVLIDAETVEGMVGEVGAILSSERFHDVVSACAKQTSRRAAKRIAQHLGPSALPLAKLVKPLQDEAGLVLDPSGQHWEGLANLPVVISLCATVYSCGPPL